MNNVNFIAVHVLQEFVRRPRDRTSSSVDDIVLQDLQTDTAGQDTINEPNQLPATASIHSESLTRGNGVTGIGSRFRQHASSGAAESSPCCEAGHLERRLVRTMSRVCESLERGERRLQKEDRSTSNRVAWQHVSLVVDRLLLMTFTVGTIAVTLGVLFHAPLSSYFIFGDPDTGIIGESSVH